MVRGHGGDVIRHGRELGRARTPRIADMACIRVSVANGPSADGWRELAGKIPLAGALLCHGAKVEGGGRG